MNFESIIYSAYFSADLMKQWKVDVENELKLKAIDREREEEVEKAGKRHSRNRKKFKMEFM